MSSSIPSWQILTAHAQLFRGARDLAFCLKVPLVWASSEGSGETARMRRLAWTFAARIGYKYQIRLTRSNWWRSRNITEPQHDKTNNVSVRPAKTQISLGIRPVWSESSLSAWRKLGSLAPMKRTAKTLIRLGGCPGWSESSLGAHSPCWFWHIVAHIRLSWVFGIDRNIRQDDSIIGHIPIHLHQIINWWRSRFLLDNSCQFWGNKNGTETH